MKNATTLMSIAGAILIAGCAAPSTSTFATPCNQGICKAQVTVVDCAKGYLPVTDDPIDVPDSQTASRNIEWTIVTDGYRFPADGIVVASPGFSGGLVPGPGKKFMLKDAAALGFHKYTVTVIRESDGSRCKPNDPFILNR